MRRTGLDIGGVGLAARDEPPVPPVWGWHCCIPAPYGSTSDSTTEAPPAHAGGASSTCREPLEGAGHALGMINLPRLPFISLVFSPWHQHGDPAVCRYPRNWFTNAHFRNMFDCIQELQGSIVSSVVLA